jgi:hypothetical protein
LRQTLAKKSTVRHSELVSESSAQRIAGQARNDGSFSALFVEQYQKKSLRSNQKGNSASKNVNCKKAASFF